MIVREIKIFESCFVEGNLVLVPGLQMTTVFGRLHAMKVAFHQFPDFIILAIQLFTHVEVIV